MPYEPEIINSEAIFTQMAVGNYPADLKLVIPARMLQQSNVKATLNQLKLILQDDSFPANFELSFDFENDHPSKTTLGDIKVFFSYLDGPISGMESYLQNALEQKIVPERKSSHEDEAPLGLINLKVNILNLKSTVSTEAGGLENYPLVDMFKEIINFNVQRINSRGYEKLCLYFFSQVYSFGEGKGPRDIILLYLLPIKIYSFHQTLLHDGKITFENSPVIIQQSNSSDLPKVLHARDLTLFTMSYYTDDFITKVKELHQQVTDEEERNKDRYWFTTHGHTTIAENEHPKFELIKQLLIENLNTKYFQGQLLDVKTRSHFSTNFFGHPIEQKNLILVFKDNAAATNIHPYLKRYSAQLKDNTVIMKGKKAYQFIDECGLIASQEILNNYRTDEITCTGRGSCTVS